MGKDKLKHHCEFVVKTTAPSPTIANSQWPNRRKENELEGQEKAGEYNIIHK